MSNFYRIMQAEDVEEIYDYESRKLAEQIPDESDRMIHSWSVRWRKEALEHYSKLGWSFIARNTDKKSTWSDEGELIGYFIAQPLLFVDGKTQSLWVEHVQFSSLQVRDELCELACKLSREKHFQKIFFQNDNTIMNSLTLFKPEPWDAKVISIKTTKAL